MAVKYIQHVSPQHTSQSQPISGSSQVPNSAGGYGWAVDHWARLRRFLILGNEGGSYYASEQKLTVENAKAVLACANEDAARTVQEIVTISDSGRAPKNDPAVFALALLAAHAAAKPHALAALPQVCRTPTMLFQFVAAAQELRGWGRGLRAAIGAWYAGKDPRTLAYQLTKYQQRDGWSHRDLLRLCHVKLSEPANSILYWAVKGWEGVGEAPHPQRELLPIWAFERAKRATTATEIVRLIRDFDLVRECIPTQWLGAAEVWDALLDKMPLTALVRNLATMTRVGLLTPLSAATAKVVAELASADRLRKSRLHPVAVLAALLTYKAGHGARGKGTWDPVARLVDALDGAFYSAFGNVAPTGKRWMLALDVSGSMNGGVVAGVPGLTPRVASSAMALVTAATEPQHAFTAFSESLVPLAISPRQRLDDVCALTNGLPFSGTDCAQPMLYALEKKLPVDVFAIYTDSETWFGSIHPAQALRQYRSAMGIPAKLIVVGMVSNGFTIADPADAGMMDVVGFDTAAPAVMSDFAAG
jgi:60 kDa SS-A/Ro ribonucleoprotein